MIGIIGARIHLNLIIANSFSLLAERTTVCIYLRERVHSVHAEDARNSSFGFKSVLSTRTVFSIVFRIRLLK